jgi:hypothetical protein
MSIFESRILPELPSRAAQAVAECVEIVAGLATSGEVSRRLGRLLA